LTMNMQLAAVKMNDCYAFRTIGKCVTSNFTTSHRKHTTKSEAKYNNK
jgi:hypothetical protein